MTSYKKTVALATISFSLIIIILTLTISYLLHDDPIELNKIPDLLKKIVVFKFEFNKFISLLFEIFKVLLIGYIFMTMYHIATSTGKEYYISSYFYNHVEKLKSVFSSVNVIGFLLIFFYSMFSESYKIFFILCWITSFYLTYIFFIKDSVILNFLLPDATLTRSLSKEKNIVNSNKNKKLSVIFIVSSMVSILIQTVVHKYEYYAVYQVILYMLFFMIYFVFIELVQVLKADYKYAEIEKQHVVNQYILNEIWKCSQQKLWSSSKQNFQYVLKKNYFNLKKEKDFQDAMNKTQFSQSFKENLVSTYKKIAIEYQTTSNLQAEVIIIRNNKNLMASVFFVLFLSCIILCSKLEYITFDYMETILNVLFGVVFFRLIARGLEIAYSFYKDIKPDTKVKNTNISNSKRIELVLKSLLEIIILCSTLYTLIYLLIEKDISNFSGVLYTGITHAIATAAFNSSFPFDTLINIKISIKGNLDIPNSGFWNWLTIIQMIHLIQLIMSIVLISLSITSYGSKTENDSYFNIRYSNNNYFIEEIHKSINAKKILFRSSTINDLINDVHKEWSNKSPQVILTPSQFNQINDLLKISLLKV